eukprot:TRINITY_DN22420_c0_g1_i2.p1 TRINITY_DN22420_c0_g1~~TRINITY_DN22420_c0_g1_i2.p1  ORF type:complete len:324 (-),score=48.74 TRINITY_DN22420_c0_g1_i2:67-1038(-)
MDEKFHREHIERTRLDVLARNVGVGVDEEQIDGAFEQVNPFNQSKPFFTRGKAHHFLNDSHGARKLLAPETLEPLYDPDYRKAIMTTRQAANWWDRNGGEGGGGGGGGGGAGDGGATDTLVLPVEERLATGSKYSARSVRSASTGAPPPSLPGSPQQHGGSVSSRASAGRRQNSASGPQTPLPTTARKPPIDPDEVYYGRGVATPGSEQLRLYDDGSKTPWPGKSQEVSLLDFRPQASANGSMSHTCMEGTTGSLPEAMSTISSSKYTEGLKKQFRMSVPLSARSRTARTPFLPKEARGARSGRRKDPGRPSAAAYGKMLLPL